jgi:hypothetical protein
MDYLASLTDKQKVALTIAQSQLKSSYTMTKSNGYLKYLSTLPPQSPAAPYAGR